MNPEEKIDLLEQQIHEMSQNIENYLEDIEELEEENKQLSARNRDLTEILDNALTCIDSDTKPTKETLKKWIETFERCKGVE